MHVPVDGTICIPREAWLHSELRLHLPALQRMSRTLDEGNHDVDGLHRVLFTEERAALRWINDHTIRPGIYTMPFLSPEYCDLLLAEANVMSGYEVNPGEEIPFQIPELVLQERCITLAECLSTIFHEVYGPICNVLMGIDPTELRTVQFAKYQPNEVGHGNWHVDVDSDVSVVVSLNPGEFTGGGTDLRTGPLASIEVPALPKGHALLFNGKTTLHRGRAVTEGRRDLLVFWSEIK